MWRLMCQTCPPPKSMGLSLISAQWESMRVALICWGSSKEKGLWGLGPCWRVQLKSRAVPLRQQTTMCWSVALRRDWSRRVQARRSRWASWRWRRARKRWRSASWQNSWMGQLMSSWPNQQTPMIWWLRMWQCSALVKLRACCSLFTFTSYTSQEVERITARMKRNCLRVDWLVSIDSDNQLGIIYHYLDYMIKAISALMARPSLRVIPSPLCCGFPGYRMSNITDYFAKKQMKKQESEFKKEMEYLANKPVFTLMDYKQRIEDELGKIRGQLRAKFNQDSQEHEKQLEMEKKVMGCLFEEELNMESELKFNEKNEIALVTQLPLEFISKTVKKFDEYKSMHRLLRKMKLNNQPLPETHQEFQQLYLMSSASRDNPKFKYQKYKETNQIHRRRHMKKNHDHGYFFL